MHTINEASELFDRNTINNRSSTQYAHSSIFSRKLSQNIAYLGKPKEQNFFDRENIYNFFFTPETPEKNAIFVKYNV